jgi:hypothetical protein
MPYIPGILPTGRGRRPLQPVLGVPVWTTQNTTVGNNQGADGKTWSQGGNPIIDQYGNEVEISQKYGSGLWLLYNNLNSGWVDVNSNPDPNVNRAYPIPATRAATAYDSINDCVHTLYQGSNANDGVIYRRYYINRDGSNNITGFLGDTNINLQIDLNNGGTMDYRHPVVLFCPDIGTLGAIICFWGARNMGGTKGTEVRSSMRVLSNTSADGVAGNWTHLGTNSTTIIANAPAVAYTAWSADNADTNARGYPSVARKSNGDLIVIFTGQVNAGTGWRYRRGTYSAGQWTLGSTIDIGELVQSGSAVGAYNLPFEVGTKPVFDSAGNCYFGALYWVNDTLGNVWRVSKISTGDVVSTFADLYSGGANRDENLFITGDIKYFPNVDRLVTTHTDLLTKNAYLRVYKTDGTQSQAEIQMTDATPHDIPLVDDYLGNVRLYTRNFNVPGSQQNPPTYTGGPYQAYVALGYWSWQ